jgi:hypothetical protein
MQHAIAQALPQLVFAQFRQRIVIRLELLEARRDGVREAI